MSYPLIIFGAGASTDFLVRGDYPYDSDLDQFIPPLTDRLFDGTKFQDIINKYPEMHKVVDYIRSKLRSENRKTLEQVLTKLYEEKIKVDEDLYVSFMSLLFYLSDLFRTISNRYYRSNNNFNALIKMLGFSGNRALFVNFNYDLLLEKTLGKGNIKSVDELLGGNFPVIKIHGSCNWWWTRMVDVWDEDSIKSTYDLSLGYAKGLLTMDEEAKSKLLKLAVYEADPKNLTIRRIGQGLNGIAFHPALALPISEKNNFICPESHIKFLRNELKKINRIVIIGWKIGDPFLKGIIQEELKQRKIPIAYVGKDNTDKVIDGIDNDIKSNVILRDNNGFSHFLSMDEGEEFFNV